MGSIPAATANERRRFGPFPLAVLAAGAALLRAAPAESRDPPIAAPVRAWAVIGSFDGKKEAENISGLACATPTGAARRACLLVSDEKRYARRVTLENGTLRLDDKVTLLPAIEGGSSLDETDAEGVAFREGAGGPFYLVVGSHGASKNDGDYQRSRFFLYRFPVDPGTGAPAFADADGADPSPEVGRVNAVEAVLAGTPLLADRACRKDGPCPSLQDGGVNVEGLASKGDHLLLGLRAPSVNGSGVIVKLLTADLFRPGASSAASATVFRPKLGPSVGIRDLVPVENGFLILTGPERPEAEDARSTARIVFWDGSGDAVTPLAMLGDVPKGAKPEAVLVLDEESDGYRLLVLSDGPAGGAPTEYKIRRP